MFDFQRQLELNIKFTHYGKVHDGSYSITHIRLKT